MEKTGAIRAVEGRLGPEAKGLNMSENMVRSGPSSCYEARREVVSNAWPALGEGRRQLPAQNESGMKHWNVLLQTMGESEAKTRSNALKSRACRAAGPRRGRLNAHKQGAQARSLACAGLLGAPELQPT